MVYLDYNATTPLSAAAREAMRPFLEEHFGNPSSVHAAGREARAAIDVARDRLAALLGAKPHEIIFTSGGTESNNLAVLGLARRHANKGRHLISNRAEHHAVLHALEQLEKREGFEVTWLDVSREGLVDPEQVERAIRSDTILVSIMAANNETGVIQLMTEISTRCRKHGVLLHSDMVQAFGKLNPVIPSGAEGGVEGPRGEPGSFLAEVAVSVAPRDGKPGLADSVGCVTASTSLRSARDDGEVGNLGQADAASFAAHKFHGPKGAGFLYLRSGIPIDPIQFGGAHENERRPGTENVAAIVGMAAAAEEVLKDLPNEQAREAKLRDQLWHGIQRVFPGAQENAARAPRLANTLNVSFLGFDSETMLMALDLEGVCASSGSACMVGSVVASHVLLAMGLSAERAASAIRFSLGKGTTGEQIEAAIAAMTRIAQRRESLSRRHAAA